MEASLVLSRHVSLVQLGPDLFLVGHAFQGPRTVVDVAQRAQLESFREPLAVDDFLARQGAHAPGEREPLLARLRLWRRHGLLVAAGTDEDAQLRAQLAPHVELAERGAPRTAARAHPDPASRFWVGSATDDGRTTWTVRYLGSDAPASVAALVAIGAEHGCRIEATGSSFDEVAAIAEQRADVVVVGDPPRVGPAYPETLRALLHDLRARTAAPILVRNQAGPAWSLDRAVDEARAMNVAIAEVAAAIDEVHVVDVDQAFALAGKHGLVDDPARAAQLRAGEDLRVMLALRGVGRRKVVVVDLDETLWPGVLAETGAPFPAHLPIDDHRHLPYLGLHEALLALRDRGILLACVSKNDEDVVKALWRYPSTFDHLPKLTLADFATYRINWDDKADNLLAIAAELNLGIDTFAFIDDNPHERARVRARLPDVMVLGDNPFGVRWQLLTQPAFQVPHVSDEARRRSAMVRGQLERERTRVVAPDPDAFLASLGMRCTIRREQDDRNLARIVELVHRTTQLNTTGERPTADDLRACTLYTLAASDRFADYGLVGVCITDGAVLRQLVLSCRVIGLGLEPLLVRAAGADAARRTGAARVAARVLETPRNEPARQVYATCGFARADDDPGQWSIAASALDVPAPPAYAVTRHGFDEPAAPLAR